MDKNVIVTGASGNLGKAVSKTFRNDGYTVFELIHKNHPLIKVEDNNWQGGVDLQNQAATSNMISEIIAIQPMISTLICTTGGYVPGNIENTNSSQILEQVKLNFITAFNTVQPVLAKMKKQGYGKIFLTGSRPGMDIKQGYNSVAYAFSKSLIFQLAQLLNDEYKSHGLSTWVIVPGTIDTPQNRIAMPGQDFSKWVSPFTIAEKVLQYCKEPGDSNMLINF